MKFQPTYTVLLPDAILHVKEPGSHFVFGYNYILPRVHNQGCKQVAASLTVGELDTFLGKQVRSQVECSPDRAHAVIIPPDLKK